jgi:hypothetical protein
MKYMKLKKELKKLREKEALRRKNRKNKNKYDNTVSSGKDFF